MQIQTEVIGQFVAFENICQQLFVAWSEHHHVVWHLRVLHRCAKVPNKQAHRIATLVDFAIGPVASVLRCHQVFVSPCGVSVADHDVCWNEFTVAEFNTCGAALVVDSDLGDRCIQAYVHTTLSEQTHQALHDGTGATHGRVHTPFAFERIDQGICTGH